MSETLLRVTLFLAYGPFLVMVGLYGLALALRACGKPGLLTFLVEKTKEHAPVVRPGEPGH